MGEIQKLPIFALRCPFFFVGVFKQYNGFRSLLKHLVRRPIFVKPVLELSVEKRTGLSFSALEFYDAKESCTSDLLNGESGVANNNDNNMGIG